MEGFKDLFVISAMKVEPCYAARLIRSLVMDHDAMARMKCIFDFVD